MRAGAYNKIVEILRKSVTTTEYGADKVVWNAVRRTRAGVSYLSGSRTEENREIFYAEQVVFTLRSYVEVEDEDRIKYGGKTYRILSINREDDTTRNDVKVTTEKVNE